MAGIMIEPIATTVATLDPEIAANMRAGRHAGETESAGQMPDHRGGERDHASGDAAAGQERCRQE